jgi:hypothetical protein
MRTILISCLLALGATAAEEARATEGQPAGPERFEVGGTPIAFPAPTKEMVEAGEDHRKPMELFVPSANRLVAAFVLASDLPRLAKGSSDAVLSRYAFVEIARQVEDVDCSEASFGEATRGAKEAFGDMGSRSTKELEDEFNEKMRSLHLERLTMKLGEPVSLGPFFSKKMPTASE